MPSLIVSGNLVQLTPELFGTLGLLIHYSTPFVSGDIHLPAILG